MIIKIFQKKLNNFLSYYTIYKTLNKKIIQKLILKKIYFIGLGYKNFILNNQLFILLGNANYMIFEIPKYIYLICKKNQIYIFTLNDQFFFLNNFISNLKRIKKINLYKGKGVIEFKNFKFLKLKQGKKQRFA